MVGSDFAGSLRMVIPAMLMSPLFLYRREVTPKTASKENNLVRSNGWEMVTGLDRVVSLVADAGSDSDGQLGSGANQQEARRFSARPVAVRW